MAILDPRLIRIGVEVRGEIQTFSDLAMTVVGTKFANPNQGECVVTIANLSQSTVDFILTETSPFNRNFTPKRLIVEAGRRSTGYSLLYTGIIFRSSITQPPDAILSIRAITGQFQKGNIVARSGAETTRLSAIARNVAADIEATLNFQATDTEVSNYSFTGAAIDQVQKLDYNLSNRDVPFYYTAECVRLSNG